jgi:cytochrome c oxidase subunit 2
MKSFSFVITSFWSLVLWGQESRYKPPAGTTIAEQYDNLYAFLLGASFIACVILIGGMIFFALKYKRKSNNDKTAYISHNVKLEFLWSFIPFVIFMGAFVWGWIIYHDMRKMPTDALEIHVYGFQWGWDFVYKNGKKTTNNFVVPANRDVKLILTSRDVIHSFFIPSMRIKQDAVPGRYTALWFHSNKVGNYHFFCTEFCGAAHSQMIGRMKAVSNEEFEQFLVENDEDLTLAQRGEKLSNSRGCVACHSLDGTRKVGPSWKGLWGLQGHAMADGSTLTVDENYMRESILLPNAKIVRGYSAGVMPSYQGQLSEDELTAIIEFIKEL